MEQVLMLMSDSLPDSEIRTLKATFAAMDENGDGQITVDELKNALTKVLPHASLIDALISQ
mgnify:CR=1 FL=1